MKLITKIIVLINLVIILSANAVSMIPFTDISETDELYGDLSLLYKNHIIKDTQDNKFHPDMLLQRDEFVGIVVGVGCKDCINPSAEEYIKFDNKPFIDVEKLNPFYYCISIGKDTGITQGYLLNDKGEYTCQNNKTYTSIPFCPENNISRIEAVTILLRSSKIWNDSLNGEVKKDITIADINDKWYGFAKKGIEIGILNKDKENKVYPNAYINRREFVHMAAKIFGINFCALDNGGNNDNQISGEIKIYDKENKTSCDGKGNLSSLNNQKETIYDFYAYTESEGDFEYSWEFTNTSTNEVKKATGKCLNDYDLKTDGKWIAKLTIKDKKIGRITVSYSQVIIKRDNNSTLSVNINANPIKGEMSLPVDFSPIISGGEGNLTYEWDFGNKATSDMKEPIYTYTEEGFYTVVLKVTDEKGNTGISQVVIEVTERSDKDKDGIIDTEDKCPLIYAETKDGCPYVDEFDDEGKKENKEISGDLKIFDQDNNGSCNNEGKETTFPDNRLSIYDFYAYTESVGDFEYSWEFTNTTTNEVKKATGKCLNDYDLKTDGKWIVKLTIKDKKTGQTVTSISEIMVKNNNNEQGISLNISGIPLTGEAPLPVQFSSFIKGGIGDVSYNWDFGDGSKSQMQNPNHTFEESGIYEVTLNVKDSKGNTATSSLVVVVDKKGNLITTKKIDINIGNTCLEKRAEGRGFIEGLAICTECPCAFSVSFLSPIRQCDIFFPTITSPDKKTFYSRGKIYQTE